MRDTFIEELDRAASIDRRIMLITGDLGFGVLDDFALNHPNSFLNAGVAEQNMTLLAAGCAMSGRVVFTYSIANFSTLRCLEMLRNDICYHDAAVIAVAVGGGYSYGALGMSHHATEDLAILRTLPGMTVVAPGDRYEVREATKALISRGRPAYLRLDKSFAPDTASVASGFQLGMARTIRDGQDLTVICAGGILGEVLVAADELKRDGYSVRVLSMHTVKPMDVAAVVGAASETGGVMTVEEHVLTGGLGSAVLEVLADNGGQPARFKRIGLPPDSWAGVGSQPYLRRQFGLDAQSLAMAMRALVRRRGSR